jgi:hypothetical protein
MVKLWGETKISRSWADQNKVHNKIICDRTITQYQGHIAFYVGVDHQDNTAAYTILSIAALPQQNNRTTEQQNNRIDQQHNSIAISKPTAVQVMEYKNKNKKESNPIK